MENQALKGRDSVKSEIFTSLHFIFVRSNKDSPVYLSRQTCGALTVTPFSGASVDTGEGRGFYLYLSVLLGALGHTGSPSDLYCSCLSSGVIPATQTFLGELWVRCLLLCIGSKDPYKEETLNL